MDNSSNSDILLKKLFATMSIEQKYAYLYTIFAFLTYAEDEDSEDIETLEENSLIYMQMTILLDDNLNLIGMTQDNLSSALSFFDNQMLSPVDYLRGVDSLILDSLLFVCSCIVETKKTEYKGHNIRRLAKDFLFDYFAQLNYSKDKVDSTINKILSFFPNS